MTVIARQPDHRFAGEAFDYITSEDALPSTDEAWAQKDLLLKVKLFTPDAGATFLAAGYDPDTGLVVGAVKLFEDIGFEAGDWSMPEVCALRGRFGLAVERDLWFEPITLADLFAQERR